MILYEIEPPPDHPEFAWHSSEGAARKVAKAAGSCVVKVTFADLPLKAILLAIMNRDWTAYLDSEELVFACGDHAERLKNNLPVYWKEIRESEKKVLA